MRATRPRLSVPITVRRRHLDQLGGHGEKHHSLDSVLSTTVRRHLHQHGGHGRKHHGRAQCRAGPWASWGMHRGARYGPTSAVTRKVRTSVADESVTALAQDCRYCPTSLGPTRRSQMTASRPLPSIDLSIAVRRHLDQHGWSRMRVSRP